MHWREGIKKVSLEVLKLFGNFNGSDVLFSVNLLPGSFGSTMSPAAPGGVPPRRFNYRTFICLPVNCLAPPCLGEALRRGALSPLFSQGKTAF